MLGQMPDSSAGAADPRESKLIACKLFTQLSVVSLENLSKTVIMTFLLSICYIYKNKPTIYYLVG